MNVLVTGAFGNIGTSAVQELLRQGHLVRCLGRKTKKNERIARRFAGRIEIAWGDVRRPADLEAAVTGQGVIVHLAYALPQFCNDHPDVAREINVTGTKYLLEAARKQPRPPKFVFSSSLTVFGYTQDQPPPRKVSDPVQATDDYTVHKLECEALVQASRLEWSILRFADTPPHAPQPLMFEVPLNTRIEVLHTADAGLAIANAMACEAVWGKVLLIGGGPDCQIYYRDYLSKVFAALGLRSLPERAFSTKLYPTDWLDTEESQRLLNYQRYSFDAIVRAMAHQFRFQRHFIPLLRPYLYHWMLSMSPYYRKR